MKVLSPLIRLACLALVLAVCHPSWAETSEQVQQRLNQYRQYEAEWGKLKTQQEAEEAARRQATADYLERRRREEYARRWKRYGDVEVDVLRWRQQKDGNWVTEIKSVRQDRKPPPAVGVNGSSSSSIPQLVDVVGGGQGRSASAIFLISGNRTYVVPGETIGSTGWRLRSADGETALIEREGEQRRVSVLAATVLLGEVVPTPLAVAGPVSPPDALPSVSSVQPPPLPQAQVTTAPIPPSSPEPLRPASFAQPPAPRRFDASLEDLEREGILTRAERERALRGTGIPLNATRLDACRSGALSYGECQILLSGSGVTADQLIGLNCKSLLINRKPAYAPWGTWVRPVPDSADEKLLIDRCSVTPAAGSP